MHQTIHTTIFGKNLQFTLNNKFTNTNSILLKFEDVIVYGSFVVNEFQNRNTNLTVFYKETSYSNLKNFHKKEYGKTDKEIRTSRHIDRAIRPSFQSISEEVTITIMLLQNNSAQEVLSIVLWTAFFLCHYSGMSSLLKHMYANTLFVGHKKDMVVALNDMGIVMMEGYFSKNTIEEILEHMGNFKKEQQEFSEVFHLIEPFDLIKPATSHLPSSLAIKKRRDGRKWRDIRDISITLHPLNVTSAIFKRGETEVLTVMDIYAGEYTDISLQYKFHPFCVGDGGETFGNSRREKGHSFLIQNSFKYLYHRGLSYKVICEVLSCNGSSSMASVNATALCRYMKYGAELISGITCGIINNKLLVDLNSEEDATSDCDIKVVSDKGKHIYSIFMDTKKTITLPQLEDLLKLATSSNLKIIGKMQSSLSQPSSFYTKYTTMINIKKEKIIYLLGKDNKNLEDLENKFEVKIKLWHAGLVELHSNNFKHFKLLSQIIDSYNSLLHHKKITCIVKSKKVQEDGKVVVNLGIFNYTTESFKYEVGDIITGVIDNNNNTSAKIVLMKLRKVN